MKTMTHLTLAALLLLQGCAAIEGFREQRQLLMGPQRANSTIDNRPSDTGTRAFAAQEVIVNSYYQALAQAQTNYAVSPAQRASPEAIVNYVDEGLALNTAFCRRWFHRIDDTQRQFAWTGKDLNIISALGTTALGLLEASAKTVAIYGAATTAVAAFGDNFSSAVLTAPGAKNVEAKVMQMLANYGAQLRADAPTLRFADAYTRLETHADLCTYATIRDVVNSALTNTEATISPSGAITTTAIRSPFLKDDASERIIAFWMPGGTVSQANNTRLRAWMDERGVPVSIPFFANGKIYEAARKQLVADLQLPEATK